MDELAAYVGWDWADQKHQLCVREAGTTRSEQRTIESSAEALHEWAAAMLSRFHGRSVGVCVESSRGAVIWALMAHPHIVLYPVNPKSAAQFREAFHPGGKKDDPVDAETLMEMLAGYQHKLRPLVPADPLTRKLALMSEHRRKLVSERVRMTNRLRANLKNYFPQALELTGELATPMACEFLRRWPTLSALKRARPQSVHEFYLRHGCRSRAKIIARLVLIRDAVALTTDPAMLDAGHLQTETLVMLLATLLDALVRVDAELERAYRAHPEHDLVDSFPGVGPVLGPRLIALLGSDRARFANADELQRFTAAAPITSRSGTSLHVHRRYRRAKFPHQTVIEWAGLSCQASVWAKAFYDAQIAAGKNHWMAARALAYKWLRILWRCWQARTQYVDEHYTKALARHGSPLANKLAA